MATKKPTKKKSPTKKPVAKKIAKKVAPKKKVVAKKPVAKKAVKKVAPKKKVVAKKPVAKKQVKKAAPKKKVVAKKATPKKKVVAKKPVAKKVVKKATPKKKVVAKKVAPKKKVVAKKPVAKKVTPQKQDTKKRAIDINKIKLSTKKSKLYKPKYGTILDTAAIEKSQTGPIKRYSDSELEEFKDIILTKLEAAQKELNYLNGLITRKGELSDIQDSHYLTMEDGTISREREQLSQMASRQISFIDHLKNALIRIENKTYGICRVTGKLIDKARLRAVPHATLSMEAKEMRNRTS